jgi:hypothetical protein
MARLLSARLVLATIIVFATALIPVSRSYAQQSCDPDAICLPAGTACPNFDLQVQVGGGVHRVYREFFDKEGNLVRTLEAGKGYELTFTNLATSKTLNTGATGSVLHVTLNPDGSSTVKATGHDVIILFPTDSPPGPTTTLYIGQVVYTVDQNGVFTLQKVTGNQVDICAALAG